MSFWNQFLKRMYLSINGLQAFVDRRTFGGLDEKAKFEKKGKENECYFVFLSLTYCLIPKKLDHHDVKTDQKKNSHTLDLYCQ